MFYDVQIGFLNELIYQFLTLFPESTIVIIHCLPFILQYLLTNINIFIFY